MIDPRRPDPEALLYTAGPISPNEDGGMAEHIARAKAIVVAMRKRGWSIVCPHLNSVEIDGFSLEQYLAEDFTIIKKCAALVLLPKWFNSRGTKREIELASKIPIQVLDWTLFLPEGV